MIKTASQTQKKGLYVIKTAKKTEKISLDDRQAKARSLVEYEKALPWEHRVKLILMRAGLRSGLWSPITGFAVRIR